MESIWTYNDITNPIKVNSLIEQARALKGTAIIELHDGRIRCSVRQGLLNLFFWPLLYTQGIPICKRHFIKRMHIEKGSLAACLNSYFYEVSEHGNIELFTQQLYATYEQLYFFMSDSLQAYVGTMDILGLARIRQDPKMQEILADGDKVGIEYGTVAIEKQIAINTKRILELLTAKPGSEKGIKEDMLYAYQVLGVLNKNQVPQMFDRYGPRTDVNDDIVRYPVNGCAISGLNNANEYMVESLSAKKCSFYNHSSISTAQYFARTQHLIASFVGRVYDGDCGTKHTVSYHVTAGSAYNMLGKNIVQDDGTIVTLTTQNIRQYIGKTVKLRSAMTCLHRDGVCEVCAGKVAGAYKDLIIGIIAAIEVVAAATQLIMSAKHLVKTNSMLYNIPDGAKSVLGNLTHELLGWHPDFTDVEECMLGIPVVYFTKYDMVPLLNENENFSAESFSRILEMTIAKPNGELRTYELIADDNQIPYLSSEFLLYIKQHYDECCKDEEFIWIPLVGTADMPIFKTVVTNDNMLLYVDTVKSFCERGMSTFTSCAEALEAFSNLVYSKVQTNITWIDILLKAYLITDRLDASIPVVTDPNKVQFGCSGSILSARSVGSQLAYQHLKKWLCRPSTYTVAKGSSIFDRFTIGKKA